MTSYAGMDCASEQEFLKGIEPFANSEISTPHRPQLKSGCMQHDICNSEPDIEFCLLPSQLKTMPVSPSTKTTSVSLPHIAIGDMLSDTAQEITKNIQKSLASSLKLEEEAKICLSQNHTQSDSSRRTSPSATPLKAISPSKPKVRFEDQTTAKPNRSITGEVSSLQSLNHEIKKMTPTKTSRQDFIFNSTSSTASPVKTLEGNFDANVRTRTPFKSSIEASLFNSLKLPQNNEEQEKLAEFLRNMESSASGDPLASLFDLEYDLKLSDLNCKPIDNTKVKTSASVKLTVPRAPEKDGDFQIKRRKGIAKRNLDKKDFSKKTLKPRKENLAKNTSVKNSINTKKNCSEPKVLVSKNPPKLSVEKLEEKPPAWTAEGQANIGNMEVIRNHLQGMLKMDGYPDLSEDSKSPVEDESAVPHNDPLNSSSDTATLLSAKAADFLPSVQNPDPDKDNVDALIDSATSSIFSLLKGSKALQPKTSTIRPVDSTVTAEISILRDSLEKERYRRNHCEKQIQKLQNRILEIQQELAVGQSVSRKKDMMIEQLDKTLAKVVTGWKNHEQSLVNSIQVLTEEKSKLMSELKKRNEVTADLKSKLVKALEELSAIRERLLLKEEEMTLLQQTFQLKTHEISRVLDQKNSSIEKLLNDKQTMVVEINKLTKNIEDMQESVEEEKKKASQDLLKEKKTLEDQLRKEKIKSDQEKSRNVDLHKMLSSTQEEVTRLEDLMGSLKQTIENLKLQSSVEEAKYAAAIRKMAAKHEIEIEKRVTEKLTKLHEEAEDNEQKVRDYHHKQVIEINKSHEAEMSNQCRIYEERIETLERRAREDLQMKDKKFVELLKEKTEGMRQQMMCKMQNLLQAHYNETLQVVGNTSGNTPVRSHGVGLSAYHHNMGTSNLIPGSKLQDISNLNVSTMTLGDTFRETRMAENLERYNTGGDTNHLVTTLPRKAVVSSSSAIHLASSILSTYPVATLPNYVTDASSDKTNLADLSSSVATAVNAKRLTDDFCSPVAQLRPSCYENEILLPMSTMVTPYRDEESDINSGEDRKQCLQHYIKMLLDRSPGEPLEIPQPTTAPVQPVPPSSLSDQSPSNGSLGGNKENKNVDPAIPKHAASDVALGVIDFLNQQLQAQPGPDLIPNEKYLTASPPFVERKPTSKLSSGVSSAFSHVKIMQKPQPKKGLQSGMKTSPKKQDTQLSLKDLDTVQSNRMEQQVGEVSRMLSAYMSGDTQEAAQKLISYLSDSQRKGMPEAMFKATQIPKPSGKDKTPSKSSLPAWR